jgi:hypothetical protein
MTELFRLGVIIHSPLGNVHSLTFCSVCLVFHHNLDIFFCRLILIFFSFRVIHEEIIIVYVNSCGVYSLNVDMFGISIIRGFFWERGAECLIEHGKKVTPW